MPKLLIALFCLFAFSTVKAQENAVPGQIMVMLHHRVSPEAYLKRMNMFYPQLDLSIERILSKRLNILLLRYNPSTYPAEKVFNAASADPATALVQFNHTNLTWRDTCMNDPGFVNQWSLYNNGTNGASGGGGAADINACQAWQIETGGYTAQHDRIVVAVIDGSFDLNHEDLTYYVNPGEIPGNGIDDDGNGYIDDIHGWNGISQNGNVSLASPSDYHATHVSGIVGAIGNNHTGISGVNHDVEIMALRASALDEASVIETYAYVYEMRTRYNESDGAEGAFVVATNSSFGLDLRSPAQHPMWCAMYDSLGKAGILSAGATANANYNVDAQGDIPTSCPSDWLISVTNTRSNDTKANAGYGATTIDLGAPGTSVYSAMPGNTYGNRSGTSMATPHVAGAIALMWAAACDDMIQAYKNDPPGMALLLKNLLLQEGVDQVAALSGITVSGGRLNLEKSLRAVKNSAFCDVSVRERNSFIALEIFPNPANDLFRIRATDLVPDRWTLVLYNTLGQTVLKKEIYPENGLIDMQIRLTLPASGLYTLRLSSASGMHTGTATVLIL